MICLSFERPIFGWREIYGVDVVKLTCRVQRYSGYLCVMGWLQFYVEHRAIYISHEVNEATDFLTKGRLMDIVYDLPSMNLLEELPSIVLLDFQKISQMRRTT